MEKEKKTYLDHLLEKRKEKIKKEETVPGAKTHE